MKSTNTVMVENDTHVYIVNAEMYPLILEAHPEAFVRHTIVEVANSLIVIERNSVRRVIKSRNF